MNNYHISALTFCLTLASLCNTALGAEGTTKTYWNLDWKITKGKTITYKYEQNVTSSTINKKEKEKAEEKNSDLEMIKNIQNAMLEEEKNYTYKISYSNKKGNIIDVEILRYKKDEESKKSTTNGTEPGSEEIAAILEAEKENSSSKDKEDKAILEYMKTGQKSALKGIKKSKADSVIKLKESLDLIDKLKKDKEGKPESQLKGSVFTNGDIQSFWLNPQQMSLLALFAQLPTQKVSVGDSWPINISLVHADQSVSIDSSYKKNEVKLTDVQIVNGEKIATLNYDICEYIGGAYNVTFPTPFSTSNDPTITLQVKVTGTALFSITNGKWKSLDCQITTTQGNKTKDNISVTKFKISE